MGSWTGITGRWTLDTSSFCHASQPNESNYELRSSPSPNTTQEGAGKQRASKIAIYESNADYRMTLLGNENFCHETRTFYSTFGSSRVDTRELGSPRAAFARRAVGLS